ncbi:MAG: PEP-CTERM sorting domain-containing protein [Planctomycetota bacterium]|jgi:hypothetical protein
MNTRLATLFLTTLLLTWWSSPAAAVSLLRLDAQVTADTFGRAETFIDDPAPATALRQVTAPNAIATFPGSRTAGVATATSVISPALVEIPLEHVLLTTDAILSVRADSQGTQSAEAAAAAGGFILFEILGGGNPNLSAIVDFGLAQNATRESPFTLTYVVEKCLVEGCGTSEILFELIGDLPAQTSPLPVSSGDVLRVSFGAEAYAFAEGDDFVRQNLSFSAALNVIPEPGTWILLVTGLLAGNVARRTTRRRGRA